MMKPTIEKVKWVRRLNGISDDGDDDNNNSIMDRHYNGSHDIEIWLDVVRSSTSVLFKDVLDKPFKLYKAFEAENFDVGMLLLPKQGEKPLKNSRENDLVGYRRDWRT